MTWKADEVGNMYAVGGVSTTSAGGVFSSEVRLGYCGNDAAQRRIT